MSDPDPVAICKGVKVPTSPFLNDTRIKRIEAARYEGDEIAGALSVVREGDRVLEMGAGLGIVGAVVAHCAKPAAVMSFEANPALIPHIRALYALNGMEDRIEVRNEVLISAENAPETVTFHVANSFLGSSLMARENRKSTAVEVPTADFRALKAQFAPDVMILDIEGGELEFLEHADLGGVRAIVIEFHPGQYGRKGTQRCKEILRAAGFEKQKDVSTRIVWTCVRPQARFDMPRPDAAWSERLVDLEKPVVVPPPARALVQQTGVLTAAGDPVPEATLWRNHRLLTEPPKMPDPSDVGDLPGTWLWGGVLWRYFPHFITESTTRVWALDQDLPAPLDGILFVPKNPADYAPTLAYQIEFFKLLGCDLPLFNAAAAVRPERLIVPGQGFGLGDISRGTPSFRRAMSRRFARDVVADGPEKLFISRSRLGPSRGALLGEEWLEAHLAEQGYEIFHPQDHDLTTQIARYRAARQVIATEGSALHLYAFAAGPKTELAMVLRRESGATRHISAHVESFTGRAPVWINHLRRHWLRRDTPRRRLAMGEPDLPAIQSDLLAHGFITDGPTWTQPDASEFAALLGPGYVLEDAAAGM